MEVPPSTAPVENVARIVEGPGEESDSIMRAAEDAARGGGKEDDDHDGSIEKVTGLPLAPPVAVTM